MSQPIPRCLAVALAAALALSTPPTTDAAPAGSRSAIRLEPVATTPRGDVAIATRAGGYDEFIVKFRDAAKRGDGDADARHAKAVAAVSRATGLDLVASRPLATGAVLVTVRHGRLQAKARRQLADAFLAEADIVYIEPNVRVWPAAADPDYARQWALSDTRFGIRWPEASTVATGAGVVVAVVDTGIVPHPDLARTVPGRDFISDLALANDWSFRDADATDAGDYSYDGQCGAGIRGKPSSWHGTHVAGIIAAVANDGRGIAGVAQATIQPIRVLGACGGTLADVIDGMVWAAGGRVRNLVVPGLALGDLPRNPTPARVLNLSLAGDGPCTPAWADAIAQAEALGAVTVVAAGNDGGLARDHAPASCARAITVGASTRSGVRAPYSNIGPEVDVLAPGGFAYYSAGDGIWSTVDIGTSAPRGPGYGYKQGTSMAAPHVAGVIALMLSLRPTLTPADIRYRIPFATRPASAACGTPYCGMGIIDAKRAVDALRYPIEID